MQVDEFQNAKLSILFPQASHTASSIKDILSSPNREFVLYDENIHGYICMQSDGIPDNPKIVLEQIELQILVTVSDLKSSFASREVVLESVNAQLFSDNESSNELTPNTEILGTSNAEAVTRTGEEQVLFSFLYHKSPFAHIDKILYEKGCILFPFSIPIEHPKKRSIDAVSISCSFNFSSKKHPFDQQEPEYSVEDVEISHRLGTLKLDPNKDIPFTRNVNQGAQSVSRSIKQIFPLKMPLKLSLECVKQDEKYLFSLKLESKLKNQNIQIEKIALETTDFLVLPFASVDTLFPITLQSLDKLNYAFQLSYLDHFKRNYTLYERVKKDSQSSEDPYELNSVNYSDQTDSLLLLMIRIEYKVPFSIHHLQSTWYTRLDGAFSSNTTFQAMPLYHGRTFNWPKLQDKNTNSTSNDLKGMEFIFSVPKRIPTGKVFTCTLFVINRSTKSRNISLRIPSQETQLSIDSLEILDSNAKLNVPITELKRYWENLELKETSLACLEDLTELGTLNPNTCQLVNLHFLALKSQVHTIQEMEIIDDGKILVLRDIMEIYSMD